MIKYKNEKKSIQYYILIVIIYILVFEGLLESKIELLRYFDELLAIMFVPIFIMYILKNRTNLKVKKYDLVIGMGLILIVIIGMYSNLRYAYQPINIVFSDILVSFKFFLVYYASSMYFKEETLKKGIANHIKFIITLLFSLTILNYVFNIWDGELRYGIKANRLFYTHQTVLTANCVFLLAALLRLDKKSISKYTVFILIMLVTTLRFKAIGVGVLFIILSIYVNRTTKKIAVYKFGIIALILVAVSFQQIQYYFIKIDNSARSMLLKTSFEIADDYFPIGTGFGTYGSYYSGVNYSPVYYLYELQDVQGLQERHPDFISDSFWPMIIGQFGYLGTMIYIVVILLIFKKIQDTYDENDKGKYISKLICLAYLLISSTAESAFVHPMAIPLALLLGI